MSALRLILGGKGAPAGPGPAPARAGDEGLVRELYEAHAAAVYGRCRYLLRDDEEARDAMQDVFVKALRSLEEYRAQASPLTWLLRIATNHCLNLLRARRAGYREQLRVLGEGRRVETEAPERRELLRALLQAAAPEEQEVAVLTFVDELTQQEVAQVMGRSVPTVRKRLRGFLSAARAALAEALVGVEIAVDDEQGGGP